MYNKQWLLIFVLMLFHQMVWAVVCEDIWPDKNNHNSFIAPDLPAFTGTNPLNVPLTLGVGDFHYIGSTESGSFFGGGNLTVTGGASTRVYIDGDLTIDDYADLNITGFDTPGDPEDLILIINGDLRVDSGSFFDARISAIIYVTGRVSIANGGSIIGTVTAAGPISNQNRITYDPDAVANADFGSLCGDSEELDHFAVSVAATASVCAATPVTITAQQADGSTYTGYTGAINITTSSGHGNWSISSGNGSISPNPDSDDNGAVQYSFDAVDNGTVTLNLANTHADELTITATESGGSATGISSTVQFSENILDIEVTDSLAMNFVAGRDHQLQIRAIRQDPSTGECGVFTEYNGAIGLKSWITRSANDPAGMAPLMTTDGSDLSLPNAEPGSNNTTLTFASGIAIFQWITSDVGQYALNVKDDSSGLILDVSSNPIPITGSSTTLTVRPFAFDISTQDKRSPVSSNPAAATAAGDAFVKAGESFDTIVRAVLHQTVDDSDDNGVPDASAELSDNGVTPAFGQEGESVQLSGLLLLPATGTDPGLGGSTLLSSFSLGQETAVVQFNEVGIIQMDAALADTDYLGSGNNITGTIPYVGRFYPHLFKVTDNTPELRHGSGSWMCDFTYMGQLFGFETEPQVTVTAYRFDDTNAITLNYGGDFWKLVVPEHTLNLDVSSLPAGSACESGGTVVAGCFDENSGSVSRNWSGETDYDGEAVWISGSHALTINKLNKIPDSGDVPFDPSMDITFAEAQLTDNDGACYVLSGACAAYTISGITYDSASLNGIGLRWGRGWVDSAMGSVSTNLPVPLSLQYWDAASSFVLNLEDDFFGCGGTEVLTSDITLDADISTGDALEASDTSVVSVSAYVGYHILGLSAPGYDVSGNANAGRVEVLWAVDSWMQYDFDGDDSWDNPTGIATFGELGDNRPILFRRETYR